MRRTCYVPWTQLSHQKKKRNVPKTYKRNIQGTYVRLICMFQGTSIWLSNSLAFYSKEVQFKHPIPPIGVLALLTSLMCVCMYACHTLIKFSGTPRSNLMSFTLCMSRMCRQTLAKYLIDWTNINWLNKEKRIFS